MIIGTINHPLRVGHRYEDTIHDEGRGGGVYYVPFVVLREATFDEWFAENGGVTDAESIAEVRTSARFYVISVD
jgi:hypothetical protein